MSVNGNDRQAKDLSFKVWEFLNRVILVPPPTLGSDRPLQLIGVKITKSCRNMLETHYHSISGEILPHFYVRNTFLAQKLPKLEHIKEIPENLIEKSLKIKSTNVCWSFFETFCHVIHC